MEDEIEDLQEEIELLKKRISVLEASENRRKALTYTKMIAKIISVCLIVAGLWIGYNYVVKEIPNLVKNQVKELNPFKN